MTGTWHRARQAVARLQPAAGQVMPLAKNARAKAERRSDRTRSWAAPQVERAGRVVQHRIAPTVSSLLSAAARRLEPAGPRRPRWRKLIGVSAVTAAAGAAAAAVRSHSKTGAVATPDEAEPSETGPAMENAAAAETGNGQRSASNEVRQNSEVRTS